MESSHQLLLTLSGILLLGLLTSTLGRRTLLPRVTLLLLFGIAIGEHGFDLIPAEFVGWFDTVADIALVMVGFLLGGQLTGEALSRSGTQVLLISVCAAIITSVLVLAGLLLLGIPVALALLLSCIASATAPAAVLDVVTETGHESRFGNMLLEIVALDDIWALALFSIGMAIVSSLDGGVGDVSFLLEACREIFGALLLGAVIGLPAAYLTGRIKQGQPVLTEALGMVFLCGGLAIWLGVSYLIAAMAMGTIIANLASHHEYPFHAIEGIEQPFLVIFFVLAGASLELEALKDLGLVGAVYIVCRSLGKIAGAGLGAKLSNADRSTRKWMGLALLPQAGVAIGMALVASNRFPEYRQVLLSLVISSTIAFELVGPVFTRLALERAGRQEQ